MIEGGFEENYQSLVTSLAEYRDGQLLGLQLSQENAGRVANAARFGVAFLVPLTFVLAVRRNQRRRQQRIALEQEIQNQRAITRAKDEAIANLSHELRTPLTSIYGFAMTLVEEPSSASPEIAQVIASESADLSRMVDDLLTAARSDNEALMFRQEVVDPVLEVKKVLDPLAHIITVETRLADAEILADRLRFRQMLRNLVSNAIKHGAAPIAIRGRVDGESYVIEVIDSGPGVSAEISARIFERYVSPRAGAARNGQRWAGFVHCPSARRGDGQHGLLSTDYGPHSLRVAPTAGSNSRSPEVAGIRILLEDHLTSSSAIARAMTAPDSSFRGTSQVARTLV